MPPLSRYLALVELAYFSYGMLFLGWSISEAIFFLWLSLIIYYPFGFVRIALAEGKKTRALVMHFFFYGMGMFVWSFILLMAMGMIMELEWQSSLDNAFMGAKLFLIVSAGRHMMSIIVDRIQHAKRTVTEAFYIGIGRLLLMFAVMFPTVIVVFISKSFGGGGEQVIAWILVIVYFFFEIKKVGHHYTKEELDSLGKQMKFL